jgi:hypothetical protein
VPGINIVEYPPPNIATQGVVEIRKNATALLGKVIEALTGKITDPGKVEPKDREHEHDPREIVISGSLDEVNEFFYENKWTDGLPIIPPTIGKVEEFLKYTDRSPDEVIGTFEPTKREGTVWKIAVNGVMAGCRPEYMPVLIAIAEAIIDPLFLLGDLGTTHGTTPWVAINGPIIQQLDFNSSTSALGPGRLANSTVGRFTRLILTNISRFLPGLNDLSALGWPGKFGMCLAEAEDQSPWESLGVERGCKPGASAVTVLTTAGFTGAFTTVGDTAEEHLKGLVGYVSRSITHGSLLTKPTRYQILVLSPLVAGIIAKGGYSKQDVKQYLFKNARLSAAEFSALEGDFVRKVDLRKLAEEGRMRMEDCTTDLTQMLPITYSPEGFVIIVSGNPTRNRSAALLQSKGHPVTREIKLPSNWAKLIENLQLRKQGGKVSGLPVRNR